MEALLATSTDDRLTALTDAIGHAAEHAEVKLSLTGDTLHLQLIWVDAAWRGAGEADTALSLLCQHADAHGWTVTLEPNNGFGADLRSLVGWYMRHGFVHAAPGMMRRRPS